MTDGGPNDEVELAELPPVPPPFGHGDDEEDIEEKEDVVKCTVVEVNIDWDKVHAWDKPEISCFVEWLSESLLVTALVIMHA